jgi:hypothetical protein
VPWHGYCVIGLWGSYAGYRTGLLTNQDTNMDPRWLDGVFARIRTSGGIDAYSEKYSVARSDLALLRAQALD